MSRESLPHITEITRAIDAGEIPLHMAVALSNGNLARVWHRRGKELAHPIAMAELLVAVGAVVPAMALVEIALLGTLSGDDHARSYLERARSLLVFRQTVDIEHPSAAVEIRELYRRAAAVSGGKLWDCVRIALLAAGREIDPDASKPYPFLPPASDGMALTNMINALTSLGLVASLDSIARTIRDFVPAPTLEQVVAAADAARERWLEARIP
jgi:hypothetical protein